MLPPGNLASTAYRRAGLWHRAGAGLIAGAIAIALNSAALALADLIPLQTARGGLLRLVAISLDGIVRIPRTASFQFWFHVVIGLAMALFYAFALEPLMRGSAWLKGLVYALAVWLANAVVVLPLTGEGFAGSAHLSLGGMLWFAGAHTLFFVMLAIIYPHVRDRLSGAHFRP